MLTNITIRRIEAEQAHRQEVIKTIRNAGISEYYPGFSLWFNRKVMPNINHGREILTAVDDCNNILGFAIVKMAKAEKKICTLRVSEEYRGNGIGTRLMATSLDILGCELPLITVPEETINDYAPLLRNFNFQMNGSLTSVYRLGAEEYYFNVPKACRNTPATHEEQRLILK